MSDRHLTRRTLLGAGAAIAAGRVLGAADERPAEKPVEQPSLVVLWLNGGPAGLFNSADSFLAAGAFGVTDRNVRALGNGLVVDAESLGALPASARSHMASVNFRHGVLRPHEKARAAVLEAGPRSQLLRLAAAMPQAPVRCAVVNDLGLPAGVEPHPRAEGGASLERVVDLAALHGRLDAARRREIEAAYGTRADAGDIRDLGATFTALEMAIHGGASVLFAQPAYTGRPDRQFDTHEDDAGVAARAVMAPITPRLSTFLDRILSLPGRNVVTMLVGEFSRTVPKSDHETGGTATVIGKRVRTGTTGPQRPDGAPPENAATPEALWAFAAAALGLRGTPFGANPYPSLVA